MAGQAAGQAGQVKVQVLNGTGTPGLAKQTARQLRALGFDVTGTGNAATTSTTTVNYAGTAQADSAYTLLTQLKGSPAAQNTLAEPAPQTGVAGTVTLTLGADWAGVVTPAQHAATARPARPARPRTRASPPGPAQAARATRPRCRTGTPGPASAPACRRPTRTREVRSPLAGPAGWAALRAGLPCGLGRTGPGRTAPGQHSARPPMLRVAGRAPPGAPAGGPAHQSAWTTSSMTSSSASLRAGLFMVACAPARSLRVTRITTIVTISASTMIPADTSKPRENPTDSAWS